MKTLLSVGRDTKTIKGEYYGILTGVLYLAPADISGFQTCPKSSAGCRAACLFTAGYGVYQPVRNARIARTHMFFNERPRFFDILIADIERLIRKAERENMVPAVRLNGTSDIAWEKFRVIRNGEIYRNIFEAFADVQFYDYTKVLARKAAVKIPNYHLTFSLSEDNDKDAAEAIRSGFNVAVVLEQGLKKAEKPLMWGGYPTIDGDVNDARFMDARGGHVVLLAAKGKARHGKDGFVRYRDEGFRKVV